jgi:hypothetical protein
LATLPMDSTLGIKTIPVQQDQMKQYDFKYFKTDGGPIFDRVADQNFTITPYRPWKHLLKVHSWLLTPGFYSAGLKLTSDNILENLHLEGGASYYYYERAPGFEASMQYGGFYPVLTAGISRFYRHPDITEVLLGEENTGALSIDDKLSLGIKIPLTFIYGTFYTKTNLSAGYSYISVKDLSERQDSEEYSSIINSLSGKAGFSTVRKSAYQNITTPLGFGLELSVNRSIGPVSGFQFQAIGDFAISGPFYNHNLVLSAGWKHELYWNDYQFMDLFLYPRGYVIPETDRMLTMQSSYHFPLVYPDLGFGGIFYCPRIRADLFADFGLAYVPDGFEKAGRNFLASVGTELIFDTKWFNMTDIPMGVRFSWLVKPDPFEAERKIRIEFVIPVIRL